MKSSSSARPPTRSGFGPELLFGALGLIVLACTLDPDDRCGPNQEIYGDDDRCVCVEGTALTANGCVACGSHEMPGTSGCVCEAGFARASATAPCEPVPAALGAPCDAQNACADATYSHCEGSYCTNAGCRDSSECQSGYACDTESSPSFCRRPPLGQGKPCTSAADCADGEATFCETFQSHQCLVQGCSLSPNDCFEGWGCCDLSAFGLPAPICVPEGTCPK